MSRDRPAKGVSTQPQITSINTLSQPIAASKVSNVEEDEYADEEFEAYEEDFEVESPMVSPKKSNSISANDKNKYTIQQSEVKPLTNVKDMKYNVLDKPNLTKSEVKQASENNIEDQSKYTNQSNDSKKYGSSMMFSSSNNLSLDPRYRRLQRLVSSEVLDLQEEKFVHMNIHPTTVFEVYTRQLRTINPKIRQSGCPNDLEVRDVEISTEIVNTSEKGIQFSNGDDTTFLNLIDAVKRSKTSAVSISNCDSITGNLSESVQDILFQHKISEGVSRRDNELSEGSKLLDFLQKSSNVIETLMKENIEFNSNDSTSKPAGGASQSNIQEFFDFDQKWKYIGQSQNSGSNELLRLRSITAVKFSDLQPNLMVTTHPPLNLLNEHGGEDLRPEKALYAVWDVTSPSKPIYLLESHGIPASITFSRTLWYLLVAGTSEGCLYMWDLREQATLHKDRDAIDLKIERGIRKPCYSTHYMLSQILDANNGNNIIDKVNKRKQKLSSSGYEEDGRDFNSTHLHPIIHVDSFGDVNISRSGESNSIDMSAAVISQFISLDLSGLVIMWVTNSDDFSATMDLGMSPWSTVKLISTRVFDTFSNLNCDMHQFAVSLNVLPGDMSSFMIASLDQIQRVSRHGRIHEPNTFDRITTFEPMNRRFSKNSDESKDSANGSDTESETVYKGFITCVSSCVIRGDKIYYAPSNKSQSSSKSQSKASNEVESKTESKSSSSSSSTENLGSKTEFEVLELLLVGRSDGGIDVFRLDHRYPIASWNISDYDKQLITLRQQKNKSVTGPTSSGIVIPKNASVVNIKWCTSKKSSFYAVDNFGTVFYFDLLQDLNIPIIMDSLNVNILNQSVAIEPYLSSGWTAPLNNASIKGPSYSCLVDISSSRSGTGYDLRKAYVAVIENHINENSDKKAKSAKAAESEGTPGGRVKIKLINPNIFKSVENDENEFIRLLVTMNSIQDHHIAVKTA